MSDWLEPLAAGVVLAITLLDVFLTVLYACVGTGLFARRLARSQRARCRPEIRGREIRSARPED